MDPRHGSFPEGGTSDLHPPTNDSATVRAVKDIAFGSVRRLKLHISILTDWQNQNKDCRHGR
jgi:hypothetical protein